MAQLPALRPRAPGLRSLGSLLAAAGLAAGQLSLAALPAAAAAPSLVVTADQPAAVPAGHNWSFDDFFPRTLTVAQGTTIGFMLEGFHSATLLPAGVTAAQDQLANGLVKPDPDDTAPNANGSTHSNLVIPFVMNIPASGCGTAATPCTFDGTSVVSAGVPLAGPPSEPFAVTVTASPGTYVFHCRVHSQMSGTLTVVAPGGAATTPSQLAAAVQSQTAADVAAGTAAETAASAAGKTTNPDGTTHWTLTVGTSSPDGYTAVLEMLPRHVTIKAGDTVTWVARGTNEIHTVTFPGELHSDAVPLCESGSVDTPAIPTVNPPTSPLDFKCANGPLDEVENGGGNGATTLKNPKTVADSGVVAPAGVAEAWGTPGSAFPTTTTFRFTGAVAGTYTYICQVHGAPMDGTLTIASVAAPPTPAVTLPPTSTDATGAPSSSAPLGLLALGAIAGLGLLVMNRRLGRYRG